VLPVTLPAEIAVRILYVSEVQWLSQVSRKHQFVRRMPRNWDILFLAPVNARPGENSLITRLDAANPNVRFRSLLLPKPDAATPLARAVSQIGSGVGFAGLGRAMSGFRPDVLVTSYIWGVPALRRAKALGIPVVYDCNDLHPDFYPRHAVAAEHTFRQVIELAAEVVSSSQRLKDICGRGVVVGNGADLATFTGREQGAVPGPIADSPVAARSKLVTYVGSIDRRLDFGIIEAVARAGAEGNYGLVLVGRVYEEARADVESLKNRFPEHVLFTGLVSYDELPPYLSSARVGIVPFVLSDRTAAINPNKLYMYAAMDENIVSTPFSDDVTRYGDLVYIESGPNDFARAVNDALHNEERRVVMRERIAVANDWDAKAREFISVLESVSESA